MPKEYFSLANASSLSSLPAGAKIHVSGVAGVAMAQLAVALANKGYRVSGSDKEFYEPMGSFLRSSPVTLVQGYAATNIPSDVGIVVIGNALSYGNEETLEVEKRKVPYTLFPKVLFDLAISGRHSIVVSGTHGKSTTTSMLAWILEELKTDPSYFIGAAVPGLPTSLKIGGSKFSVVEGDEYDSSFFAKVPKFTFYRPDSLIVTAIEFDHADIYPTLEAIVAEFSKLIGSMKKGQRAICCIDDPVVRGLLPEWQKGAVEILTYGFSEQADFRIQSSDVVGKKQKVSIQSIRFGDFSFELSMPGKHNASNAAAALLVCLLNGLDATKVCAAFPGFQGAKRRQEVRVSNERAVLVDDFAHHPTAVRETIAAIRAFYPGRRLWAVFEPRSNTSRRKVFQEDYIGAFRQADQVVLCDVQARSIDVGHALIDVGELAQAIGTSSVKSIALPNPEAIRDYVLTNLGKGDVVLVMSNGGFGGLVAQLEQVLKS